MAAAEVLLADGPSSAASASPHQMLEDLRLMTARDSNGGYEQADDGTCSHRPHAWLLLLHTETTPYEEYAALLERGASPAYGKIQDDVHRTLTTDPYFGRRVTQSALTRLMNATAWQTHDKLAAETPLPPSPTLEPQPDGVIDRRQSTAAGAPRLSADELAKTDLYVQGMNVLSAPILYVSRSEPAAFALFNTLLREQLASYFMPGLAGVHVALGLLEEAMALVDPELKAVLPPANVYAFGPVMTLCASIPPLSEVLRLWDFLFAAGPHLGVLAVVAILVGMRDELLGADKGTGSRLRNLGPLDGIRTIQILKEIVLPRVSMDESLSDRIATHTHVSAVQKVQ